MKLTADKLQPKGDFILLREIKMKESKILLPETVQQDQGELVFEVVAVGTGGFNSSGSHLPMETSVGDVVMLRPGAEIHEIPMLKGHYLSIQYDVALKVDAEEAFLSAFEGQPTVSA